MKALLPHIALTIILIVGSIWISILIIGNHRSPSASLPQFPVSNNLSDLSSQATARANLGLGNDCVIGWGERYRAAGVEGAWICPDVPHRRVDSPKPALIVR